MLEIFVNFQKTVVRQILLKRESLIEHIMSTYVKTHLHDDIKYFFLVEKLKVDDI